jgi:hypothetical protein
MMEMIHLRRYGWIHSTVPTIPAIPSIAANQQNSATQHLLEIFILKAIESHNNP